MDTPAVAIGGGLLHDEAGLRAAHREHAGELFRFVLRQLRDTGAAEDVVQEVFLRAWRSAGTFDAARGSVRAWLFAIARNLVIDHTRRRSVRPVQPVGAERLIALAGGDGGFDEATMTAWTVEEALRRLSDEHRVALVETYLRGRPYGEVSAELGVPVGTVRSRVFYGLKALRLVLDEMGVEL
ncbi:sigma-70 family RNA polymerase sigma factor [Pseudonocardia abyssalis]|jgi:RNA polymerase sigma-70 factor (ECF subfamily)|uniref:RNA polymerase sigma factor n=1 Tax=Pseudonocardia abyssalis TaxID=2792008 RepID=A0ABS6UK55_9PSEU|nr:sigma-70 family RNA polymerase sigma factor [Pseudonocardia abyssalis]MBW0116010.1 sigma-70 family RNA polymerase sigma factor [Pseudonocardia abyssalis]MBW0132652.1 sigma-70 family RNA polymerase sigma factor [Pseudonocardia abyssalis]